MALSLKSLSSSSVDKTSLPGDKVVMGPLPEHEILRPYACNGDAGKPLLVDLAGYHRSSCAASLKIALSLRGLPYALSRIFPNDKISSKDRLGSCIRSGKVPILSHLVDSKVVAKLSKPVSALGYLERLYLQPDQRCLLPPRPQPYQRSQVRAPVDTTEGNTHSLVSGPVARAADRLGIDVEKLLRKEVQKRLAKYEKLASKTAGKYSVGDQMNLADVCLVPCV